MDKRYKEQWKFLMLLGIIQLIIGISTLSSENNQNIISILIGLGFITGAFAQRFRYLPSVKVVFTSLSLCILVIIAIMLILRYFR